MQATIILRRKDRAAINEDRGIVKGFRKGEEWKIKQQALHVFFSSKPANFLTALALWGAHCSPNKLLLDVLRKGAN